MDWKSAVTAVTLVTVARSGAKWRSTSPLSADCPFPGRPFKILLSPTSPDLLHNDHSGRVTLRCYLINATYPPAVSQNVFTPDFTTHWPTDSSLLSWMYKSAYYIKYRKHISIVATSNFYRVTKMKNEHQKLCSGPFVYGKIKQHRCVNWTRQCDVTSKIKK